MPLHYLILQGGDDVTQLIQWKPLTDHEVPLETSGEAGSRKTLQIGVRRAGLAEATLDPDGVGSQYESLLVVTNGAGYRRYIPVAAQVPSRAGLWNGFVQITHAQWITANARLLANDNVVDPVLVENPDGDTVTLRPTAADFTFPILIHLDSADTYKMLREVTLLYDPGDVGAGTEARFVLGTPAMDPAVRSRLEGGSIVDGQPFGRRMSTAAFAFDGDLPLTGDFDSALSGETTMTADHRLNPYRHTFHPDHAEGVEITRTFRLNFAGSPLPGADDPAFGYSVLGGDYTETIIGLHRDPITVRGRFELRRVIRIATLNANQVSHREPGNTRNGLQPLDPTECQRKEAPARPECIGRAAADGQVGTRRDPRPRRTRVPHRERATGARPTGGRGALGGPVPADVPQSDQNPSFEFRTGVRRRG